MATTVTTAFPVIGSDVPPPGRSPARWLSGVVRNPPHWIYHLAVSCSGREGPEGLFGPYSLIEADEPAAPPAGEGPESLFSPLSAAELGRLAAGLGLPGRFAVRPLEYVLGAMPEPGARSRWAFPLPPKFAGRSWQLPLLVGLVACGTDRPLPPWVLLTGCLAEPPEPPLRLAHTQKVEQKVRLALGDHPAYDLCSILDHYYQHPAAGKVLGPRERRVTPGGVKLFVCPTEVDAAPASLLCDYAVEACSLTCAEFARPDFEELRAGVERLAGDDLLVVQVPAALDALCLLGYHHWHATAREYFAAGGGRAGLAAFIVRRPRPRNGGSELLATRERHLQAAYAQLEARLTPARDIYEKLRIFLEQCVALLQCDSGDVAIAGEEGSLRVVARSGRGVEHVPYRLPAVSITGRVLRSGKTTVVPRTAEDSDFGEEASPSSPLAVLLRDEFWQAYRGYLQEIRSAVVLPLVAPEGGAPLGVIRLARRREGEFDEGQVQVVEALAQRIAADVAHLVRGEKRPEQAGGCVAGLTPGADGQGNLAGAAPLSPADAPAQLGRELAERALQMAGADRVMVRRIPWGQNNALVVIGLAGAAGAWPAGIAAETFSLDEGSAAAHAIRTGQSYRIPDTACKGIHYQPIPPEPRSHVSVPLQSGRETLGVLSVDWDRPGACDDATVEALQQLAARYAIALKALSIDPLFATVERWFASIQPAGDLPDLTVLLETVAQMVGARHGAIFLRRPETGRYHLAAHLTHRGLAPEAHWYEKGEGATGWTIKHNKALRVLDLADAAEMREWCQQAGVDPADPPRWKCKLYDGLVREDPDRTYLGVPIAAGAEVLGVLRLVTRGGGVGFTRSDEQVALAIAARLAGWLYQREQARRNRVFKELTAAVVSAASEHDLARAAFGAVREAVGPCACLLRPLDRGAGAAVLRRLAVSDPAWERCPALLRKGEALAGKVWAAGRHVYEDAARDPLLLRLAREGLHTGVSLIASGSGVCTPLFARRKFVGTFHVHRPNRFALTPGDLAFIDDVANLLGAALEGAARTKVRQTARVLHRAAQHHQTGVQRGQATDRLDAALLTRTNRTLMRGLGGSVGCVWVLVEGGLFRCLHSAGVPREDVPDVSPRVVRETFAGRPFLVTAELPAGACLLPGVRGDRFLHALAGRQQAAFVMAAEEPLALFLIAGPPAALDRWVELATSLIERLGKAVLLGRHSGEYSSQGGI